jgi:anionic cell wall polymer biosynthesis LytR-Cps2A-Psr (LCP) family protein
MVGLPIQYGLVFDFSKFQTIINLVGGVDIDVPEAFTDTQYPIAGKENDTCSGDTTYACRYETLQFTKGIQHMDGPLALKYVRSRHAEGAEGNDFARGRRQQQILVALKEKLTSKDVLKDPQRIIELYRAFDDATDTDMNIAQLATIGKLFLRVPQSQITRISIESQLYEPPVGMYGRYVLLPSESFDSIHTYVTGLLK